MPEALNLLMRWIHITGAITLLGGMVYARLTEPPGAEPGADALARFRGLAYACIAALLVSGTYNLLTHPGHTPRYHALLGIKVLLALHVFAVAVLLGRGTGGRRTRLLTGSVISGLIVVALADYLRTIL